MDAIGLAEIRDRRRAAWVRGGVRLLLPGDDRAEPGAYVGEYRHRNGLEAWDGSLWRGTRALPALHTTTISERRGVTEPVSVAALTVPDPGWPYQLTVSASAELVVSDQDGENVPAGRADLSVRLDALTGPVLATGVGPDTTVLRGTYRQPVVRLGKHTTTNVGRSGTLTGTHTVHLVAAGVYGDPGYRHGVAPFNGSLFVQAVAV
ncbi:hypothetical protein NLX83_21575 [Allokutzneria sp. A3M-2-11 16]|uniref:hypothetical protein n=1 Tax=Allokutzneria sp. A3M-2-11 16 TaxID=2962043 RepID=UPI0020B79A2C|nr:hypothetical protein [Allokutzneria sp. A3M-2-11 16]MCP3801860.1 hypothetical protein [Allokutzneria sp. A3M-2-11 16]